MQSTGNKNGSRRRVVLTGIGPIAPNGMGKNSFWEANVDGVCAVEVDKEWEQHHFATEVFARVRDFQPENLGLSQREIRRMDRHCQMGVVATDMAIADAGLTDVSDYERIGVNIGTAISGTRFMDKEFIVLTDLGRQDVVLEDSSPYSYMKSLPSHVANEISARYGFKGVSVVTATGCTAGIDAVGISYESIKDGQADVMVTGATEAPLTPITIAAFDIIKAVSRNNDLGPAASRPFSKGRDGFVLAEGAGIVVLEELAHARSRGAHIYAEILGFASTSNAYHMTGLHPDGEDLARAISLCLGEAELGAGEIDYINAHGSSTYQNDLSETGAFKHVFGPEAYNIPISSTKSMIGHALGAASALEIIVTALAVQSDYIPPTMNYEETPECDLDYVPGRGRQIEVNTALSVASGFSGLHSAICLGKVRIETN